MYDSSLSACPVSESDLSGSIPVELGKITSLTGLCLNDNQLSGEEGILAMNEKFALRSNVSRIGYVAQCNLILNYSSRTACTDAALQHMRE